MNQAAADAAEWYIYVDVDVDIAKVEELINQYL